jgi:hypothetical protein
MLGSVAASGQAGLREVPILHLGHRLTGSLDRTGASWFSGVRWNLSHLPVLRQSAQGIEGDVLSLQKKGYEC